MLFKGPIQRQKIGGEIRPWPSVHALDLPSRLQIPFFWLWADLWCTWRWKPSWGILHILSSLCNGVVFPRLYFLYSFHLQLHLICFLALFKKSQKFLLYSFAFLPNMGKKANGQESTRIYSYLLPSFSSGRDCTWNLAMVYVDHRVKQSIILFYQVTRSPGCRKSL